MGRIGRLTSSTLERWYGLLDAEMTTFDCGELCAPANAGVPVCCDQEQTVPLLFRDEYRYQRERTHFWRRYPRRTPEQRRTANGLDSLNDWACLCQGAKRCRRNLRALVCRLYPFMPFVDGRGEMLGLTYMHGEARKCPLVDREGFAPSSRYIRGSLLYWEEVFGVFPEERQVFVDLGKKVRRRYRRLGRPVPLFFL